MTQVFVILLCEHLMNEILGQLKYIDHCSIYICWQKLCGKETNECTDLNGDGP